MEPFPALEIFGKYLDSVNKSTVTGFQTRPNIRMNSKVPGGKGKLIEPDRLPQYTNH